MFKRSLLFFIIFFSLTNNAFSMNKKPKKENNEYILLSIPEKLLIHIIDKTSIKNIKNIRKINKKLKNISDMFIKIICSDEELDEFLNSINNNNSSLKSLYLNHCVLRQKPLDNLKVFSRLKTLDLSYSNLCFSDIQKISCLKGLTCLDMDYIGDGVGNIGESNNYILDLPNLKSLKLSHVTFDDKDIDFISNLTNLTDLDLQNTMLTNESIPSLIKFTKLKSLNLLNTSIDKIEFNSLKNLYIISGHLEETQSNIENSESDYDG